MTPRERLIKTINHEDPGEVVVDLGSSLVTGISASALAKLRKALGLEEHPIRISEPFQVLGEVEEDIRQALGVDVVPIAPADTMFGYSNTNWKPWKLSDGTDVLVGSGFTTTTADDGVTYIYPKGDTNARPSARMPKGGFYFDMIVRQGTFNDDNANARNDFASDYMIFNEEALRYVEEQCNFYYNNTKYGLNGGNFLCGLGDFCPLPGPAIKEPHGIRSPEDWLVAHYTLPSYIKEAYDFQTEVAIENLKLYKQAVGDKVQTIQISGTDFGTQRCEFISPDMYREFYKPYHQKINEWVHNNTNWKTFYHTCGSIINILDDMVECGVDIINPVQCSAVGMDPRFLKEKYGNKLVFWGGGVNTQETLPFGSVDEVRREVLERLEIFAPAGGFVFNTIHNIQSKTPVENIIAIFDAVKEYNTRLTPKL
ncbi:MAG: methyltransferase [Clostridiales bacterium GWC2_40_7]|nr:MAG: methyltransferase [Clostridiales bacterium GWC2_40_7]